MTAWLWRMCTEQGAEDSGCRDIVQGANPCTQRMALCYNMVTWAYEMHFY
jgi:hypothetical protein